MKWVCSFVFGLVFFCGFVVVVVFSAAAAAAAAISFGLNMKIFLVAFVTGIFL